MDAVAGKLAGAAGVRAPIAHVDRSVRTGHHLARAEERIVALHEFELAGDLERGAIRLRLVSANEFAEDVRVVEQAAVLFRDTGVVVDEQAGGRTATGFEHGRHLAGHFAGDRDAGDVRSATAGAVLQTPAEVASLGHVHDPATHELAAVFVIVVRVEPVELVIVGEVAIRVAVAEREGFHLRAVGLAAEHGPGSQHRGPAAVRSFGVVVVVATGNVEQPVVADGDAGDLVMVEAAEALGDDLADVPRAAFAGLLPAPHRASAGDVQPAVVVEDAGGKFFTENRLRRAELPGGRVKREVFHHVQSELLHCGDLLGRAILEAERLFHFEPVALGNGVGHPLHHEQAAIRAEGHADRIDHLGVVEQHFHAEALGQQVALELGVELALIDHLDWEGQRLGGRLRLGELGRRRWRQGARLGRRWRQGRERENECGKGEVAAAHKCVISVRVQSWRAGSVSDRSAGSGIIERYRKTGRVR